MNASVRVIRGKVENLSVHAGEEEFIRSRAQRTAGGAAAMGLALGGLAGPAVGGAMAATGADSVEFFTCTVNGEPVGGRFSKVTFKEGDEVEVVVEGADLALAVRRPADRMLWMFPHCARGHTAHVAYSFTLFVKVSVGLMALLFGFFGILEWRRSSFTDVDQLVFMGWLLGINVLLIASYFSVRFLRTWRPFVHKSEAIFAALGYHNPSRVDLERDSKRAAKVLGEKWPYPTGGPWIYRYPEDR